MQTKVVYKSYISQNQAILSCVKTVLDEPYSIIYGLIIHEMRN